MPDRRAFPNVLPFVFVGAALAGVGAAVEDKAAAPLPTPTKVTRPDLVRLVRLKLSAGDLASAEAWTEDWKREIGGDATWLDARAWLARGALMLGQRDRALAFAREVRAAIPEPRPELLIPLGAALEVEGRIRADREGRAAGARFFHEVVALSPDVAFRSRMWKNVNRLELVGRPAPPWATAEHVGAPVPSLESLRGRPVLLYLWAAGCGDCRASAFTLARLYDRFAARGLAFVAPTRLYRGSGEDALPPEKEKAEIARTLGETYAGLPDLSVPVDAETMVRYGASATPTFVLVDRDGIVRLYEPTRLTLASLSAAIEPLLAPVGRAAEL